MDFKNEYIHWICFLIFMIMAGIRYFDISTINADVLSVISIFVLLISIYNQVRINFEEKFSYGRIRKGLNNRILGLIAIMIIFSFALYYNNIVIPENIIDSINLVAMALVLSLNSVVDRLTEHFIKRHEKI